VRSYFFFSSRRRHTRFSRDWSSDVCSSDLTCVKYRLPIKIFVLKNNTLGMIRWEQMMFMGNPEYGTELQNVDFAKVADAFGLRRSEERRVGKEGRSGVAPRSWTSTSRVVGV